jgi:hypothetical protein
VARGIISLANEENLPRTRFYSAAFNEICSMNKKSNQRNTIQHPSSKLLENSKNVANNFNESRKKVGKF